MSFLLRAVRSLRALARPRNPVASLRATLRNARQYANLSSQVTRSDPQATLPAQNVEATLPAQNAPQAGKLPYHISRNSFNRWGVYNQRYRGGSKKVTLVKNVHGNLEALRNDVAEALRLPPVSVKIDAKCKRLVIVGEHARDQVIEFIEAVMGKTPNEAG